MDGLFGEISQAAAAMNMNMNDKQSFNPYAAEQRDPQTNLKPGEKPSSQFSDAELMEIYQNIQSGNCPPEMKELFNKLQKDHGTGNDGKPIIDEEGGTVIQPNKGFVVKTKDVKLGGKMFINMTQHDFVDPFESKAIPQEQQEEHGAAETGLRIPLSLGDIREESDKKGDPAQVVDIIWAPVTIEKARKDATFRQVMVELAFNYIFQKYSIELDLRYTVPKLNYKGATVQFQRVRAKKAPKIQEVELTQEQREELERRNLEEQKMKEALAEKKPAWSLYYDLEGNDAMMTQEYWSKLVDTEFEKKVGGEEDRWNELRDGFALNQTLDVFEEFDGLNHSEAKRMVLLVTLPLLVRGNSVQIQALEDIFSLRVPNLYKLQLSLPVAIDQEDCISFYDCKLRRMIIVAPISPPKVEEIEIFDSSPAPAEEPSQKRKEAKVEKVEEVVEEEEKIYEVKDEEVPEAAVEAQSMEDDLLFDVV